MNPCKLFVLKSFFFQINRSLPILLPFKMTRRTNDHCKWKTLSKETIHESRYTPNPPRGSTFGLFKRCLGNQSRVFHKMVSLVHQVSFQTFVDGNHADLRFHVTVHWTFPEIGWTDHCQEMGRALHVGPQSFTVERPTGSMELVKCSLFWMSIFVLEEVIETTGRDQAVCIGYSTWWNWIEKKEIYFSELDFVLSAELGSCNVSCTFDTFSRAF